MVSLYQQCEAIKEPLNRLWFSQLWVVVGRIRWQWPKNSGGRHSKCGWMRDRFEHCLCWEKMPPGFGGGLGMRGRESSRMILRLQFVYLDWLSCHLLSKGITEREDGNHNEGGLELGEAWWLSRNGSWESSGDDIREVWLGRVAHAGHQKGTLPCNWGIGETGTGFWAEELHVLTYHFERLLWLLYRDKILRQDQYQGDGLGARHSNPIGRWWWWLTSGQ